MVNDMKKTFIIIGIIVAICVSFVAGLFLGRIWQVKPDIIYATNYGTTFYATIEEIKEYNGVTKVSVKGLEVNDINYRGRFNFSIKDNTYIVWRGEKITVSDLAIGNNIVITFTDETVKDISPTPLENVITIQLLDDKKYEDYEKVTSLKLDNAVISEGLVKFGGVLYGKSGAMIDYAGGVASIGKIDKLIDSKYVPKLDGETNKKEILNADVYPNGKNEIVLNYNNNYVLFERVNTTKLSETEIKQKANKILGSNYCNTDHNKEVGGDALTGWTCKSCGQTAINPTTNTPEICEECSKITGRYNKCGKLERK